MAPAAAALPPALGGGMVLDAKALQGVELPRYFNHDVATTTPVSPVRASARNEFLAAEAQLPAPTIARLDEDFDAVSEHEKSGAVLAAGRPRTKRLRPGPRLSCARDRFVRSERRRQRGRTACDRAPSRRWSRERLPSLAGEAGWFRR